MDEGDIFTNTPIGVIIPPPEIKKVVDKPAEFVAKNGSSFENLILKSEEKNPHFSFLRNPADPYRPYYEEKVAAFATGSSAERPATDAEKAVQREAERKKKEQESKRARKT